jgi:cytochrome P450
MTKSAIPNLAFAQIKAACLLHRLPPGGQGNIENLEKQDRYYLLHQAKQLGPIFKAQGTDRFWVCITGLARCRRFIQAHASRMHGYMHDLEPMVPGGALRRMEGEIHRKYRRALLSGIQFDELFSEDHDLHEIVSGKLAGYASAQGRAENPARSYVGVLNDIATASLMRVFFGIGSGDSLFEELLRGYRKLGPFGPVWNIGNQQIEAFAHIRRAILNYLAEAGESRHERFNNSITGRLSARNALDDTLLGNLIYMVEMGRYDLAGLLRWLSRYAASHPDYLDRIAAESWKQAIGEKSFAHAFVLETLRTDKSERLTRIAEYDLLFDGYLIPRNTYVRLCLWESHHDAESFDRPFEFNPDRFLQSTIGGNRFAPFGLDHHLCPLADIAIRLGITFLWQLAGNYRVRGIGDGLPIRGPYHWEPALDFTVELHGRSAATKS